MKISTTLSFSLKVKRLIKQLFKGSFFVVLITVALFLFFPQSFFTPSIFKQEVKILFVGDVMFDRTVRSRGEVHGYPQLWGDSLAHIENYDIVIANLEGPITKEKSVSLGSEVGSPQNTRFTFSERVVDSFPKTVSNLLHIGNNHILDFGMEGLESTKQVLERSGVRYFGDIQGERIATQYIELHDLTFAFVSFNQFLGNGIATILRELEKANGTSDIVILYAHWGEEYRKVASPELRRLAHSFIDAGADLIVGSHSHVVGEVETYKGKFIYYSLGNFIFDQHWDKSVRCGVALSLVFSGEEIKTELIATNFATWRVEWGSCK